MAETLGGNARTTTATAPAGARLDWADGMLLFTAILFGSSFPSAKPVMPALDPVFYASARYLLGAAVIFLVLALRRRPLGLAGADRKLLALCCVTFALFQGDWAFTLSRSNASEGAIFMATSPIFGALLASLSGQRLRPVAWFGIALAFCGVMLVINNSVTRITVTFGSLLIDFLWLCNSCLWAFFVARSPRLIAELGPARMFAWVMLIGAALLLPLGLWHVRDAQWDSFPTALWVNFFYTALITGALASTLWNVGMRRLGITRTMIYMYLVPIFAVGIAVMFLGETVTVARAIGGVAVLAGIAITRRAA